MFFENDCIVPVITIRNQLSLGHKDLDIPMGHPNRNVSYTFGTREAWATDRGLGVVNCLWLGMELCERGHLKIDLERHQE